MQLGWYFDEHLVQECNHIFEILGLRKDRFIFMFPDFSAKTMFEYFGFQGDIVNHNCFIDENLFKVVESEKIYDAIYTARLVPFKRHYLASKVDNLALIAGSTNGELIKDLPQHKYINESHLSAHDVIQKLAQSKVGLLLSDFEGACYSSSEYLLCGLPVVSTRSHGGRDIWYNAYNSIVCDANPESVSEAVQKLAAQERDPHRIREMHIQLSKQLRLNFIRMHQKALIACSDSTDTQDYFNNNFKNKLLTSETPNFNLIFE